MLLGGRLECQIASLNDQTEGRLTAVSFAIPDPDETLGARWLAELLASRTQR